MNRRRCGAAPTPSLEEELRGLLLSMLVPVCIVVVFTLVFLISYNAQYAKVFGNIARASQFNQNFKDDVDLKMYYYVIGNNNFAELPIDQVETAQTLAQDLLQSTEDRESRKAVNSVLDLCDNLRNRIYEIERTQGYNARVQQLDTNVYILTELIQKYMYDYLYYEAGQLAQLQETLNNRLWLEVVLVFISVVALVAVLLRKTMRLSRIITRPIDTLCQRAEAIGHGDLAPREPVAAGDRKLQTLSESFEHIAAWLNRQMEVNRQEQARLRSMELALLQAQINPHFLYNTLDTIIWLIETDMHEQAVEIVASLSRYFRTSLSKGSDIITLREEELHVRSYLEIQQVRYRDILRFEIDMEPSLCRFLLPKLTLQPLVENALYHGIKCKRGAGVICVKAWKNAEKLLLLVSDTGAGMTPERLEQVRSSLLTEQPAGFGMATVYKRLRQMFGEQCQIAIESEEGVGTTVTIFMPARIEQEGKL